ncbi:MAG: hypothetical protein KC912_24890 [Proteobacteria bacterium]|nr:hypothetical protein [Pseudomonadota bacterium]
MADPDHTPVLDRFDRFTVVLYRLGLVGQAVTLIFAGMYVKTAESELIWAIYAAFVALAALNMHLYMKTFRWVIHFAAWLALVLQVLAPSLLHPAPFWVWHVGLGFLFVASSAWALKERYCFRVPGMRLVPLLLAGSLIPIMTGGREPFGPTISIAGGLFTILAIAKLRMPLHFDVGDKSKYQV